MEGRRGGRIEGKGMGGGGGGEAGGIVPVHHERVDIQEVYFFIAIISSQGV